MRDGTTHCDGCNAPCGHDHPFYAPGEKRKRYLCHGCNEAKVNTRRKLAGMDSPEGATKA